MPCPFFHCKNGILVAIVKIWLLYFFPYEHCDKVTLPQQALLDLPWWKTELLLAVPLQRGRGRAEVFHLCNSISGQPAYIWTVKVPYLYAHYLFLPFSVISNCTHGNGGCGHLCFIVPDGYHCGCPSGTALREDGYSCQEGLSLFYNGYLFLVCTWRHHFRKCKPKEPPKLLSSSGIRGVKFISVYNFSAH